MTPTSTTLPVASPEQDTAHALIMLVTSKQSGQSLEAAIDELDRELAVRDRCYERWVKEGKLSKTDSRDRFARMAAAHSFLSKLADIVMPLLPAPQEVPNE